MTALEKQAFWDALGRGLMAAGKAGVRGGLSFGKGMLGFGQFGKGRLSSLANTAGGIYGTAMPVVNNLVGTQGAGPRIMNPFTGSTLAGG